MDALLQELQSTKPSDPATATNSGNHDFSSVLDSSNYYHADHAPPVKMGSYVEPGQEHLTTNIFVGNLDPMTTEEELTDAFRQFGDLYSVKIMWPRTAEERARNRNTGFVCFMARADAEDAMDAYQDADPLDTGRRLVLRWGKNVKKTVKFGTGGVPTNLRKKPRDDGVKTGGGIVKKDSNISDKKSSVGSTERMLMDRNDGVSTKMGRHSTESASSHSNEDDLMRQDIGHVDAVVKPILGPVYDPKQHAAEAIIVTMPSDPYRVKFITTVASFVAKDGSILEQKLIEAQSSNPDFYFLLPRHDSEVKLQSLSNPYCSDEDIERLAEHIFYRWRVYSFAQGDGINSWRTEPFVMIEPNGRFWIPPPLNREAAQEEEEAEKRREEVILAAQEERRKLAEMKGYMTGRQLEHAKYTTVEKGGGIKLNDWEREKFHDLLRNKLCASQDSICDAMAFAFDKSGAAQEISGLLKEAMLESTGVSVDTRIARLFLLSDILFNSQQPGVRNAFHYRDAIEAMSPEVFESLGKHGYGTIGRMTMNKLRRAVSSVLSAWTNWSVYNSTFLDELQARFEGRELPSGKLPNVAEAEEPTSKMDEKEPSEVENKEENATISTVPRGEWKTAEQTAESDDDVNRDVVHVDDFDGEALDDVDGEQIDDVDGEALDDIDGEVLEHLDGVPIDDDIDGDVLDDVDGEALDADANNGATI